MIGHRVAADARRRLVGAVSAHGGLTSLVIGVLTWTWAQLAPVRTHVAAWVEVAVERLPDGAPPALALVAVVVAVLTTGALVLLHMRRAAPGPAPAPVRTTR